MTEFGETTMSPGLQDATPQRPPPTRKNDRKRIKVRVSLFFDGTGNNRVNTTHRLEQTQVYRRFRKEGSYGNDYSNVARLEMNVNTDTVPPGYDYYVSIYTEGIGTTDSDSDTVFPGQAMGMGETGVVAKVDKGLLNACAELGDRVPAGVTIEELAVDTFGFSRGAAAARYCVHRVRSEERRWLSRKRSFKELIEATGRSVEQIEIRAVGLFDTVSALGLPKDESDVQELKLDAIREAKAVLQLAAAEEYRQCFSLTNIDSAGGKGQQVFLPGAHSDIGGGYVEGDGENKKIIKGVYARAIAVFLRKLGWCHAQEVTYHSGDLGYGYRLEEYTAIRRHGISQEYSFIPLRTMADFATEQELVILADLYQMYDPVNVPGDVRARIEAYAASGRPSAATDWQSTDPALLTLRHDFLHFSAKESAGMWLRTIPTGHGGESARPYRLVFRG